MSHRLILVPMESVSVTVSKDGSVALEGNVGDYRVMLHLTKDEYEVCKTVTAEVAGKDVL